MWTAYRKLAVRDPMAIKLIIKADLFIQNGVHHSTTAQLSDKQKIKRHLIECL
jgi:hypothetical protein